jgi:hypothetical protein
VTITAALWFTMSCAVRSFGYGWTIGRFFGDGVAISSADRGSLIHVAGCFAATRENADQSSADSRIASAGV